MSSSRIHCCYIQSLRKNISLSKMRCFVVQSSALGLKKKVCPFLPLENSRPLSPLREPQTPLSSSGTPDFLSAYLGIDSLRSVLIHLQVFGDFPSSFLLLISNLISLCFKSMLCIISSLLNFLTCGL